MTNLVNSFEIADRLAIVESRIAGIERQQAALAHEFVSGSETAQASMDALDKDLESFQRERKLLKAAEAGAKRLERANADAAMAEVRAASLEVCQEAAKLVLKHAARLEQLSVEAHEIYREMDRLEGIIRSNRTTAGLRLSSALVGSEGFSEIAAARFSIGRRLRGSVSEVLQNGLRDLLEEAET